MREDKVTTDRETEEDEDFYMNKSYLISRISFHRGAFSVGLNHRSLPSSLRRHTEREVHYKKRRRTNRTRLGLHYRVVGCRLSDLPFKLDHTYVRLESNDIYKVNHLISDFYKSVM